MDWSRILNTGSLSLEPTFSAIIMHCLLLTVFVLVIFVINKPSLSGTMPEHYIRDWGCQKRKDGFERFGFERFIKSLNWSLKVRSELPALWRVAQTAFASEWTIHHTWKVLNVSSNINYEILNISLLHSALRWALIVEWQFSKPTCFQRNNLIFLHQFKPVRSRGTVVPHCHITKLRLNWLDQSHKPSQLRITASRACRGARLLKFTFITFFYF